MTRKEMRDLEEAETEAALRREVAEAQAWNDTQRPRLAAAVRCSGISRAGAPPEPGVQALPADTTEVAGALDALIA